MNKKWMISGLCGSMLLFGASLYGFAQGKIANPPGEKILFSLEPIPDKDWKKAKTVTSIPIDQLGKLKLRIYSGNKTFKELYGKFWGNLRSGLDLAAKFIPKGQTADFSDTKKWLTHYIAEAKEDSEWPDSNTLEIDLLKAAKGIKLWEISSDDDIAFAVQYTKEKKTGKTVWVNNGWVDETYWETLGKPASTGVLKIEPPTKENTAPDVTQVKEMALKYMNTDKTYRQVTGGTKFNYSVADYFAHVLIDKNEYPSAKEGFNFDGSKITNLEIVKGPSYGWNYDEYKPAEQMVYASYDVTMDIHGSKTEMLFIKNEIDAKCTNGTITLKKMLNSNEWQVSGFGLKDVLKNCQKK